MSKLLLNIGHNNVIAAEQVVAIVNPNSSPMKRLRDDAKKEGRLIDACQGRKTRSIVVMASNHVILAALEVQTLTEKFNSAFKGGRGAKAAERPSPDPLKDDS
ncbi:MAG: DUF370 domain-containing protein [Deltaproteobacteria bacterium]|jgi:regulator of extracellular matrix RemA (YlzA/DUF370 family)|nr:DUF370 domain-containing protein [Deltaproteobacteria bacterium]